MAERTVETRDTSSAPRAQSGVPVPGPVLLWSGVRPSCVALRFDDDAPDARLALGRGGFGGALDDARASRQHAWLERHGDAFIVEDCGSRNGTMVDGERIVGRKAARAGAIVRIGQSLVLLASDVRRFELPSSFDQAGMIVGPTLAAVHAQIARSASAADGGGVLFLGESGSGKELAARVFHEATGRSGALVAVNCAAIPLGVAERLLFGAKRGAFSGADADADGYMQAADKGTLFLDEVAELEPAVQAKLLRAIETREVFAVGASKPKRVDLRVCAATHRDLRREIAAGRFRQDLYFRIGQPEIAIPALRERPEEIPWLVAREVERVDENLHAHAAFVEACLLRAWPGNVRELLAEVRRAALEARARGDELVRATDLSERAGHPIALAPSEPTSPEPLVVRSHKPQPDDDKIRRTLREHGGNVTSAAKALGMHRTQLRRWVDRHRDG